MIERKMTWDEAVAEIARLTKLRALDEQQFAKLQASFDEVVRQRDEYRAALKVIGDGENWFHTTDEPGSPHTAWRGESEPDEIALKALKARQAGEGDK